MRHIFTHTTLLVIALTVIIMAAGRNVVPKKYNSNAAKKEAKQDSAYSFDTRHFITPLSRFY